MVTEIRGQGEKIRQNIYIDLFRNIQTNTSKKGSKKYIYRVQQLRVSLHKENHQHNFKKYK